VGQAGEEAGREQQRVARGERAQHVAERERGDQRDQELGAGDAGAETGEDRRAEDDAERVRRDHVAGRRERDADAVGDLGRQPHREELRRPRS